MVRSAALLTALIAAMSASVMDAQSTPESRLSRRSDAKADLSRRSDAKAETTLATFWEADSTAKADVAAQQLLAAHPDFDTIWRALKAGRTYAKQRTGRIDLPSSDRGVALDNVLEVPAEYDAARAWPLRISLHGGVSREPPGPGGPPARALSNRTPVAAEIVIHPRAFAESEWWKSGQVDNIFRLLDRVKRSYNIDESRTYVTGISDGGTGVYFLGMRAATPWAACMPLNGHPSVLANPDTGVDGELFAGNLANCPLSIVNGGRDPLYPAASVQPFVDAFTRGGIPLVFQVYPEAGHDVSWWPQERARYESFLASHSRVAHPEHVSWETERTDRYNRFRWVVIDRLGKRPSDASLPDLNTYQPAPGLNRTLYDRPRPSGRADVSRQGNAFDVKTRGVQALTLLLSPDVIDFARAVRVTVNGKTVHDAIVKKDVATLLKWAARDNDRTMLYAAELRIVVP